MAIIPRKVVCGYLSKLSQHVYPNAVVYSYDEGGPEEDWAIEFPFGKEEPINLGNTFKEAKYALLMLERAKNESSEKYWIYHGVRHYVVVLALTKEDACKKVEESPEFDQIGGVIPEELELVEDFEKKCRPEEKA